MFSGENWIMQIGDSRILLLDRSLETHPRDSGCALLLCAFTINSSSCPARWPEDLRLFISYWKTFRKFYLLVIVFVLAFRVGNTSKGIVEVDRATVRRKNLKSLKK